MADVAKMELFVFFQDWDDAIDMLVKGDVDVKTNLPGIFQSCRYTFFEGFWYRFEQLKMQQHGYRGRNGREKL